MPRYQRCGDVLQVGVVAAGLMCLLGAGPTTGLERLAGAPADAGGIRLDLSAADKSGGEGNEMVFGGGAVMVDVRGRPRSGFIWRLGYRNAVVAEGRLVLDENGKRSFPLRLGDVRVRCQLRLAVTQGDRSIVRRLEVVQSRMLSDSIERIGRLKMGVIDDRGAIQKALVTEELRFEDLSTRLLQDAYGGQAVLIGGFGGAEALVDACQRLEGRVAKGLTVVVFDPPAGWRQWGVSRSIPATAADGAVTLAAHDWKIIRPTDLGVGPRRSILQLEPPWEPLAWVEQLGKKQSNKPDEDGRRMLAAIRDFGRGRIAVVLLDPIDNPAGKPVQREILDEMVLWVLIGERTMANKGEK